MHYPFRTLSTIGLISLSLNAWADTSGGFNSILQSAASGPATQAGKLPIEGAPIKGLPASLGGQKPQATPAAPSPAATTAQQHPAPVLSARPNTSSVPAKTPTSTPAGARPAVVSHPPMVAGIPQGLPAQGHINAPVSTVHPLVRPAMPQAMPSPSALSTPTAMPSHPPYRVQNPLQSAVSSQGVNPAATGYVNPFVGQPGVIEKLSNRLAIIKLKNEIAKEEAVGAKYRSEAAVLSQENSPQMQALSQTVAQMKARLEQLESRQKMQAHMAKVALKRKASHSVKLVGIVHNDGDNYAMLQVGKRLLTLSKGAMAGNATIQSIGTDYVQLSNGDRLRVPSDGIGHYAATSWKGTQATGGIIPPQSAISAGLMAQARQAGIPLPGAQGKAPINAGAQQIIHFPQPGMQP